MNATDQLKAALATLTPEAAQEYTRDLEKLMTKFQEYREAHRFAVLGFALPSADVVIFGGLDYCEKLALDQDGRDFVRWLDKETGHRCTALMFIAIVEAVGKREKPE